MIYKALHRINEFHYKPRVNSGVPER